MSLNCVNCEMASLKFDDIRTDGVSNHHTKQIVKNRTKTSVSITLKLLASFKVLQLRS